MKPTFFRRLQPRLSRFAGAAFVAGALLAAAAAAQGTAPGTSASDVVYRREVFQYPRGGRPAPFRSLLGAMDEGVRAENLVLRGIVYSPDAGASFAVVTEGGSNRAMRLRVGQRLGNIQVVAIQPRRVDLMIQDLGGARRESLVLREAGQKGTP